MKKNINKKNQPESIDSNTFLNNVIPSIKVSQKAYQLDEFGKTDSKNESSSKSSSLKQT